MLDIKFIRENKELIQDAARKKKVDIDIATLIELDDKRREIIQSVEAKKADQNEANAKIASASSSEERMYLINDMKSLKEKIQEEEEVLKEVVRKWQMEMIKVPNIPDMSVPEGESDEDNKEIATHGEKKTFSFQAKSHVDLMLDLDMADFERGTKVSGFRGYILKNEGALLNWALWHYVMDTMRAKGSYTPLMVPSLVRKEPFVGTGYLPQSEEDLYKTQDDLYLSGTAEVATMGMYMNEIIDEADLPMKFIAFSPAFRREAGSHGKDTKGLMRVHEFMKLEQVILCEASHQTSVEFHEELLSNAEEILTNLEIPYRVVVNCAADLGLGQVKKYDIEAWVPSENKYRETHSCSYFHDFQTRRLNIRYRGSDGKLRYVHSLNNTAVATPRFLIPLVENYQQEDGSIKVPKVLQKYMGCDVISKTKGSSSDQHAVDSEY